MHRLIVEAMTNFKAVKREKARFNQLLVILKKSKSVELKVHSQPCVVVHWISSSHTHARTHAHAHTHTHATHVHAMTDERDGPGERGGERAQRH
jgi:hypothetical protein